MAPHTATVLQEIVRTASGAAAGATDRELLRRFAGAGDQAAFATLFRRHSGLVLGVCRRTLANIQDAEDACQATFLVLARKAGVGHWQPSLANWLYATARRVARNARVAAERRTRRENRAAVPEAVEPVDRMTGRELLAVLDEELDRLPPQYREALILCYLQGLTRDEAAARLDVPLTTLKSHLERGRKRLGDALTRRGCVAGAGLLALAATSTATASSLRQVEAVLAAVQGASPVAVARLAEGVAARGAVNKSVAAALLLAGTVALGFGLTLAKPPATAQPRPDDSAPAAEAKPAAPAKPAAGSRQISGRVVGPDGKPVAGAKLFTPVMNDARPVSIEDVGVREIGVSGVDGRYTVSVSPLSKDLPWCWAIAYAPGFGVDWVQLNLNEADVPGEQVLRLPEDVPIVGRLVSTEGRPLAGLSVVAAYVAVPSGGKLDDYLGAWKRNIRHAMSSPRKSLPASLHHILGPTLTDRDGRFTIRGTGGERVVELLVWGGGMARSMPFVVTRRGFDPKPYNDLLLNKEYDDLRALNHFRGLFAPEFTFVMEAGRDVSGVITDSVTGEPVAGCGLVSGGGYSNVTARSDARGRYRLEGLSKTSRPSTISAMPPAGSDYLPRTAAINDDKGLAPTRLDIRLVKGSVVKGRVIDKQTGKGLRAYLHLAPLPGNKVFGTRPEFSDYATNRTAREADGDGKFRMVTIPGPAILLAQVGVPEMLYGERFCRYRQAVPDPDHRDLFRAEDGSWIIVTAGNGNEFLSMEHADKVIDVKETGETEVDLFADPGVTAKISVQDADGRPLAGARVAGLTEQYFLTYRLPEATATVYALDPGKPRTLALHHAERRLGGLVTVRGDEKEPVVARLSSLGRVTGRLLDGDGQPLAGMTVSIGPRRKIESALYDGANAVLNPVRADRDGRFVVEGIVAEMPFHLGFRKGKDYYAGKPKFGPHRLKPGETLDLGDRVLQPSR
jgi:RNA polymerase sigma factor (sigma-70 family)